VLLISLVPAVDNPQTEITSAVPQLQVTSEDIPIQIFDGNKKQELRHSKLPGYDVVRWSDITGHEQYNYPKDALVATRDGKLRILQPDNLPSKLGELQLWDEIPLQEVQIASFGSQYWEPDFVITTDFTSNDPEIGNQWAIDALNLTQAWDVQLGSQDVVVAIIDTGVDYTHPDLQSGYLDIGYDFVNDDTDVMDGDGHGTHVAGIISASINNGIGIAGAANVSFFAQKVLDDSGSGTYSDAIAGIYDAVDKGAHILSNSWGGSSFSQALQDAVNYAHANGVMFVAAAGNDASSSKQYPAALDNVISVGSLAEDLTLSSFSNYGDWVDIVAPGSNILSTYIGPQYASLSGTSMATPYVSAIAALIWSEYPGFSATHVENQMYATTRDLGAIGYDTIFGHGMVEPYAGLTDLDPLDATINIRQLSYNESTHDREFAVDVVNLGSVSLETLNVSIELDGSQVDSVNGINLESGQRYTHEFVIDSDNLRYNLTTILSTTPGELRTENNVDSLIMKTANFSRIGDHGTTGIVPVEIMTENWEEISEIRLIFDDEIVTRITATGNTEYINFPVFASGNQTIGIHYVWADGSFVTASHEMQIGIIKPIVDMDVGDEINWIYEYEDGSFQQQHWTVAEMINDNVANFTFYVNLFDDTTLFWEYELWAYVDLRNGLYIDTNFEWDGNRFSWITNLDAYLIDDFYAGFFAWNSVLTAQNTIVTEDQLKVNGSNPFVHVIHKFPEAIALNSTTDTAVGYLQSSTLISERREITVDITTETLDYNDTLAAAEITNTGTLVETIQEITVLGDDFDLEFSLLNATGQIPLGSTINPGETVWVALNVTLPSLGDGNITLSVITTANGTSSTWDGTGMKTFIDQFAPVVTPLFSDLIYQPGTIILEWLIEEYSLDRVDLFLDGNQHGSTLTGEVISTQLDLTAGVYNITLVATDTTGNTDSLTQEVIVESDSSATETTSTTHSSTETSDTTKQQTTKSESAEGSGLPFYFSILGLLIMIRRRTPGN
jgi:hypothetical protein